MPAEEPVDPFAADGGDPAGFVPFDDEDPVPLTPAEREDVLTDLEDLELFRTLLEPRGVKGLVVDCEDCQESHYFGWDLIQGNLQHLLEAGTTRVHEPAFSPDPDDYVSWDYAHGWVDAVTWLTELDAES